MATTASTPPPELPTKLDHYIGGAPAASADGATFEVAVGADGFTR